jgi:hypothetical protein
MEAAELTTSGLSNKTLKDEATRLGMDCSHCLERCELVAAFTRAKQVRVHLGISTGGSELLESKVGVCVPYACRCVWRPPHLRCALRAGPSSQSCAGSSWPAATGAAVCAAAAAAPACRAWTLPASAR